MHSFQATATSRIDGGSGASPATDDAGWTDDATARYGATTVESRGRRYEQYEHAVAAAGEHAAATGRDAAAAAAARLYYAAQHSAVNALDGWQQSTATTGPDATHADSATRNGHTAMAAGSARADATATAWHGAAAGFPRRLAAATNGRLATSCSGATSAAATNSCTTWN